MGSGWVCVIVNCSVHFRPPLSVASISISISELGRFCNFTNFPPLTPINSCPFVILYVCVSSMSSSEDRISANSVPFESSELKELFESSIA